MNNERYWLQTTRDWICHPYLRLVTGGEVIKILDVDEENVMNKYKQEEVLAKIEPDQMVGATAELASNTRRSGQTKIANRQSVEEEEQLMLATVDDNSAGDKENEDVLAAVAHFIMVHYEEKE
jgi:hypothetical protein